MKANATAIPEFSDDLAIVRGFLSEHLGGGDVSFDNLQIERTIKAGDSNLDHRVSVAVHVANV